MSDTIANPAFEELRNSLEAGGTEQVLKTLTEQLMAEKRYHDVFDARLIESRLKLGLPALMPENLEEIPEPKATQVREAYLEACKEVGRLFLEEKSIREAWMYLGPARDQAIMAKALEENEPEEDEFDEWVGIAVQERVAPRRGFELVLNHLGTCNAVTMYDQASRQLSPKQQDEVASLMVAHLYEELRSNLNSEVAREEGSQVEDATLSELLDDREWLFENDTYHIDTSHLSMVIRFARQVTNEKALQQAIELTEYGKHLSAQYRLESEEPFTDTYPSHQRFFAAQLGKDVEENIKYFQELAMNLPPEEHGVLPIEVYICLLARLERYQEAFDAYRELIPTGAYLTGLAPTLLELAQLSKDYDGFRELCQEKDDRVNFVASLLE